ncbi:MAG TPA: cytochrome C assembly protein, partial [Firmicutes bacterium]|nr:cytochrome C assembly protein [Bacillota bacterium]
MHVKNWALWLIATILVIVGFVVSVYLVFIGTGIERNLGFSQKIFYFHVPCAWITYLAFGIAAVSSVIFLIRSNPIWDSIAYASIELGTVFTTLVIVTGPLWARPTWGAYWVWDPRLTTTLILWLIELSYLLLRAFVDEPEKAAKYGAILALLGALDIPIIHYSVVLWRGMHPAVIRSEAGSGGLPHEFFVALMVSLATFTLLFFMLLIVRVRL